MRNPGRLSGYRAQRGAGERKSTKIGNEGMMIAARNPTVLTPTEMSKMFGGDGGSAQAIAEPL